MKVGTRPGLQTTYTYPHHLAQCLVIHSPKTKATFYDLLYKYKYTFLLQLSRLIFQSEIEMFPSGSQEKEQLCQTKNVQNSSKREITFGLTELLVVQPFQLMMLSFSAKEILQKQTGYSGAVVFCLAILLHSFMKVQNQNLKQRYLAHYHHLEDFVSSYLLSQPDVLNS